MNGASTRPIRSISVIGAGLMGRGIALAAAQHGMEVKLTDASADVLARSLSELESTLANGSGPRNPQSAIRSPQSDSDLASSDLIIEAVVESLPVKKQILSRLEPLAAGDTLFASNTSSLRISQIAESFSRPERFCGLHFCHPVAERGLVEVVRGEKTRDATLQSAEAFVRGIAKLPIGVADGPGFVVNRLLSPYLNESVELLCEGVELREIEEAAIAFGMPWGPITQIDSIGIDVAVRAGAILFKAFPSRILASGLLVDLYRACRLGEKAGAGFFAYDAGHRGETLAPDVVPFVEERRVRFEDRGWSTTDRDAIARRIFLPMLVEATRVLEERIVADPLDVDRALVHGLGFSAAQGGIVAWADRIGAAQIVQWLQPLSRLGERYHPTPLLLAAAQSGACLADRQFSVRFRRSA